MSADANIDKDAKHELPASWQGAWKIAAGVGVVGLAASGGAWAKDPSRFAHGYLFAFITFLTVALGSLFFVLIQRLTGAYWSVTVRRTAEFFASALPIFAILFIPIAAMMDNLFPWTPGYLEHHKSAHSAPHEGGGHGAAAPEKKEHTELTLIKEAHAQPAASGHGAHQGGGHGGGGGAAQGNHDKQPGAAAPAGQGFEHGTGKGDGKGGGGEKAAGNQDAHPGATDASHEHGLHKGGGHGGGGGGGRGNQDAHPGAHPAAFADPHHIEHEELLHKKSAWLNKNFFLARAAIYFVIWAVLGTFFFRASTSEDGTKGGAAGTLKAQRWAPIGTFLFGLSLTFAMFDWIMALDPTWFSTIFGVYIFATAAVSSLATIVVVTMQLQSSGALKNVVNTEHFHDLGKLLFGFIVFWAYIGFSQFMLIWYAALPEETPWYHKRWETPSSVEVGNLHGDFWTNVSLVIFVGHFVVPFLFLMSRNVKRRLPMLKIGAAWVLVLHALDIYWFVLPNFEPNFGPYSVHWVDFTALLGVGGVYLALVFFRMTKHPLIPTGDPRLRRALAHQNA